MPDPDIRPASKIRELRSKRRQQQRWCGARSPRRLAQMRDQSTGPAVRTTIVLPGAYLDCVRRTASETALSRFKSLNA